LKMTKTDAFGHYLNFVKLGFLQKIASFQTVAHDLGLRQRLTC
jgi:hypothetical protein